MANEEAVVLIEQSDKSGCLFHQTAPDGRFRLVYKPDGDRVAKGSTWTPYELIATLSLDGKKYFATSPYYRGLLPAIGRITPLVEHT